MPCGQSVLVKDPSPVARRKKPLGEDTVMADLDFLHGGSGIDP
jgi:hypothetical protein